MKPTGAHRSAATQNHAQNHAQNHTRNRAPDTERRRARAHGPTGGGAGRIAVGGAGLMAARTLVDQGRRLQVFEKSRGPGGRAATWRIGRDRAGSHPLARPTGASGDGLAFDQGAQCFTAARPRVSARRGALLRRAQRQQARPRPRDGRKRTFPTPGRCNSHD